MKAITGWIKKQFRRLVKPNPYVGLFIDWNADIAYARSPDGWYLLWTGMGYLGFRDCSAPKALLKTCSIRQKWQIWRALKHDLHEANIKHLRHNVIQDVEE